MTETNKEETWQEREAREAKEFRDKHLPKFFKTMEDLDVKYFAVEFSGGGDDGSVENPVFVKDAEIPSWSSIRLEVGISDQMQWDDPNYQRLNRKADALHRHYLDPDNIGQKYVYAQLQWDKASTRYTLNEYINEFVCMYMSSKGIDWYNNDGGDGEVIYENGKLTVEGQTYYREDDPFEFEESYDSASGQLKSDEAVNNG